MGGLYLNLSQSLKEGLRRKKGLWDTTRQLTAPKMAPQFDGQLFRVYLPIFNFKY